MNNKKAFTLTELLVALGIVGAIASLAIPSLLNNINNRLLVSQLKNTVAIVQQLASEQLVTHKTQNLRETDFGSTLTLLTSRNFEIAKTCSTVASAARECWKTTAAEADKKIIYRKISDRTNTNPTGSAWPSIILKNGVILSYRTADVNYDGQKLIGEFCVDVNGNDSPNIVGRDYFCFYVTQRGKIVSYTVGNPNTETNIANCKNAVAANSCTKAIIESNWNMTY